MQKTCFKCNRLLDMEQFYKHSQMGDGHLNKCKDCTKRDVSTRYTCVREERSAYEQMRAQDPERKAKVLEYQRQRRMRSPEKYKARQLVGIAVRDGRIVREPCSFCGKPDAQAHHHDYNQPLDVVWACFKCHREQFHGQIVVSDR